MNRKRDEGAEYDLWAGITQPAVCWPDEDEAYDRQRQEQVDAEAEVERREK